jgi:hypothetical protein
MVEFHHVKTRVVDCFPSAKEFHGPPGSNPILDLVVPSKAFGHVGEADEFVVSDFYDSDFGTLHL